MNFFSKLISFCKQYKSISVYGTGNYGMMIKFALYECNISINAFVVSDNQEQELEEIDGIKVIKFSKWLKDYGNDAVIVAIAQPIQKEICENLREEGINNFYCINEADFYQKSVGILDTSIAVENHGNEIIMQAVTQRIKELMEDEFIFRLPFIDEFRGYAEKYLERCEKVFLGGTNALNSAMDIKRYIGISSQNIETLSNKIILMGVGWWRYEDSPNEYTVDILHRVLSKDSIHSVRDSYTEGKLRNIGITNVVNTGCPTIWNLNKTFCEKIPRQKGKDAIIMFTPGDRVRDAAIVKIVYDNYRNIFFWPQGPTDYLYIKSMCPSARAIPPQLSELEKFLDEHDNVDYIGTRLHGGIKCLQHKKRSIILSIDNRAIEMGKDFNLPVFERDDIDQLQKVINDPLNTEINIPEDNIKVWTNQFEDKRI